MKFDRRVHIYYKVLLIASSRLVPYVVYLINVYYRILGIYLKVGFVVASERIGGINLRSTQSIVS